MLVYWRVTIIDHTYQPAPDLMILQVSSLGCGKNAPSKGTDAQLSISGCRSVSSGISARWCDPWGIIAWCQWHLGCVRVNKITKKKGTYWWYLDDIMLMVYDGIYNIYIIYIYIYNIYIYIIYIYIIYIYILLIYIYICIYSPCRMNTYYCTWATQRTLIHGD